MSWRFLSRRALELLHDESLAEHGGLPGLRDEGLLASALASKKRFPPLLAMFARLGEQTGQLPLMLQRAATQRGVGAGR